MNNFNPHASSFRPTWPAASYTSDQQGPADHADHAQARAYYHQWAQYHGYMGYQAEFQPYNGRPRSYSQHGQQNYPHPAQQQPYSAQHHPALTQDPQRAFDSLLSGNRSGGHGSGFGAPVQGYPAPGQNYAAPVFNPAAGAQADAVAAPPLLSKKARNKAAKKARKDELAQLRDEGDRLRAEARAAKAGLSTDAVTPDAEAEVEPVQKVKTKKKNKKAKAAEAAAAAANSANPVEAAPLVNPNEDPQAPQVKRDKRGKEPKIMLPAPPPTKQYLAAALKEPSPTKFPTHLLVILDLNGTLLHRPSRNNKKRMIARPFLEPFLRYLASNFDIMVWSSARPENVKALVNQSLDDDLRSKLLGQWGRDSFGLSPEHYDRNVQVYKNLDLVWNSFDIQKQHPTFATGGRFGQHNTILIDDSILKANAQPHNLLQITEFVASPADMRSDVLREVVGYLEAARKHSDVSSFIHKEPFKAGGKWTYEWPQGEVLGDAHGGELIDKMSITDG